MDLVIRTWAWTSEMPTSTTMKLRVSDGATRATSPPRISQVPLGNSHGTPLGRGSTPPVVSARSKGSSVPRTVTVSPPSPGAAAPEVSVVALPVSSSPPPRVRAKPTRAITTNTTAAMTTTRRRSSG